MWSAIAGENTPPPGRSVGSTVLAASVARAQPLVLDSVCTDSSEEPLPRGGVACCRPPPALAPPSSDSSELSVEADMSGDDVDFSYGVRDRKEDAPRLSPVYRAWIGWLTALPETCPLLPVWP